ncbi:MAG: 4Fe-4S dicluster domain-containing protein, partial [Thermoanaerobaculia bacterium]
NAPAVRQAASRLVARQRERPQVALCFRPDPTVWDGRFANLGWLQECPKPVTKLTWDNALLVSPATAQALGIETEQVVRVSAGERSAELPVWVQPGQADDCLTVHLGGGRTRCGRVGNGVGVDVYPLRTTAAPWTIEGVSVAPAGRRHQLVSTQLHHDMELASKEAHERHVLRVGTLDELRRHPEMIHEMGHEPGPEMTLYRNEDHPYEGHAWALAVDLNACTGCNACVVACQAENNIPVVGKEQVAMGREMQWIRIDRYFEGDLADPQIHSQPVMCMHCENAPCEVVCPVAATVHSDEGLNDMVYNRCVGTRYCANNCPYKVRRFNFFHYSDYETPVLKLLHNPNVTVRTRGVMEKCTYCVQRIEESKIEARVADRQLADGDIRTACQQACPSQAIAFGDKNDPDSEISRWRRSERNYALLADLNTRPRTTYLAKIRNPNPAMEEGA